MGRNNRSKAKPQGHKTRKAVAVSLDTPAPRKPASRKTVRVGQGVSAEWQARRGIK
jgi:hypothetical protein